MQEYLNSEIIYDRYADAVTALVMEQYMTALAESLAAEDRAPVEIGAELDGRCRKLIKKGYARQLRRSVGKKLLRGASVAAIVFLLLCGVFAVLFSTVEAIRVPIINFFIEQKEKYLEITGKDQDEYDRSEDVLAGLVPEGYTPVECRRASNGNLTIWYVDAGDGMIYYNEFIMTNGTFQTDTEDAVIEDITIGGRDALLIEKYGYKVVWYSPSGEVVYQLEGNQLSREEIIAIAEAIERGREETAPADSDDGLAAPTAPEYRTAAYDYVSPEGLPLDFRLPQPHRTAPNATPSYGELPIEIGNAVAENVTFSGFDAPLIELNDDQIVWYNADGEQTGEEATGRTVVP